MVRGHRKSRRYRSACDPHTFLMTQIRNVLQKWHPGSTVLKLTSPKTRSCEVCLRSKMTNVPCRRRTGEAVTRAEQFGDLITADHRDLNEEGESRNNHRYAVVAARSWPFNGDNLIRAKQKLLRRRKRVHESVSSRQKSRKSFTLRIHWNLANPVKIYHGIIELRHLINPRRMVLLKERYAEKKRERLLYCCNQAWMKNGGLILWNAIAICEMSKTSWQMGKLIMEGDSEDHLKVQSFFSEQRLNIIRFPAEETSLGIINSARKFCQEYSSDMR